MQEKTQAFLAIWHDLLDKGNDLSVFKSTPYLKRLNNPTPWTKISALTFKNYTRGACKCVSTSGQKMGMVEH